MIIQTLKMKNFRQFYGMQTIQFAQPGSRELVTVILGENGRGKTGIYRAMMFALFGDIKLIQDAQEANVLLANIKAVEEQAKVDKGTQCTVALDFSHQGENFTIERVYFAMKDDHGKQKEELFKVHMINHTTKKEWYSDKEIKYITGQIIDERVKHYFFFDGERIERLTRASSQQRQEVTAGIKNLLKIDQVFKTKQVFNKLLSDATKELEQLSTGDYKKALQEKTNLKTKLESKHNESAELEQNKANNLVQLTQINEALNDYNTMRTSIKEREKLEDDLKRIELELENKFEQSKQLNKYLPLLMGENLFQQQLTNLSYDLLDQEGGIESSFIDSLLEDMRCICGTSFDSSSPMFDHLTILSNSVKEFEKNKGLHKIQGEIKQLTAYLDGRVQQIEQQKFEINELLSSRNQTQYQLEEINKRLSHSGESKMNELNREREQLSKDNLEIDFQLKKNEEQEKELYKDIVVLDIKLKELEQQSGLHQSVLKKRDILEVSLTRLEEVIKKFESELLEELELTTSQNLFYLLDRSGREIIQEAKVTKNYNLEVLNNYGQSFLANISQGQRQVLSLSFITALAQVAGGAMTMEMPLFMDTPFGRLSGKHQENLIEYLPQVCSQWILLVTDKEFGVEERGQFMESNTIGRFYELVSEEAGVTRIREVRNEEYQERLVKNE